MTHYELELAAQMLDELSGILANRCCNDFDFPDTGSWTPTNKTNFVRDFEEFNSSPEDYEQGDTIIQDYCVASLLAAKLRAAKQA